MPEQTGEGLAIEVRPEDDLSLPEGWELVEEDSEADEAKLDGPVPLEDVVFLKGNEGYVGGEEVLKRAKKLGPRAGLRCAKALLRQQSLIPAEWRGKKVLVFTGTVARDQRGDRRVAYLYWGGVRWCLRWPWLDDGFGSDYRVVRLRK